MSSPFSIELSQDVIRLAYLLNGSWTVIGDVSTSSKCLDSELSSMIQIGREVHPGQMLADVLLPRSHVRYESTSWDQDERARQKKILRKLSEVAVFAKGALTHDWAQDGELIRLAIVDKVTLLEAERFVMKHGLIPAMFTARSRIRDFPRAPVFLPRSPTSSFILPE